MKQNLHSVPCIFILEPYTICIVVFTEISWIYDPNGSS